ncbi:helicase RepA family protein, partial [Aeromonas caviae]|uniref:helicase RepA family protein n=1 Tax=Aeromonas caviae TaxID=648 RepID=UPI001CC52D87
TLRRFHQLDENDGGHMAGLLAYMEQLCRENSTTVLFHVGQQPGHVAAVVLVELVEASQGVDDHQSGVTGHA